MNGFEPSKSAENIEAQAAEWLGRRELDGWNEDDSKSLEAWLKQSLAHRVAFVRLDTGWKRTERLAALRIPMRDLSDGQAKRRSAFLPRAIAGVAIFGISVAVGASYLWKDHSRIFSTPVGGHEVITLADGSSVELNTNTVLRANGRSAELIQGEAYFQIKHDAAHPFVVRASGQSITDLGTAFLVRQEADRLVVRLVEGSARIGSDTSGATTVLRPGDVAVAKRKSVSIKKATVQQLEDNLSWRRGLLVFDQTTLALAAAEFNRYNREKLVIGDPAAGRMTIGGTFPSNDVALFSRVAEAALGLHLETRGADIVVSLPAKASR